MDSAERLKVGQHEVGGRGSREAIPDETDGPRCCRTDPYELDGLEVVKLPFNISVCIASPQGDLRLSGPPSGQGACGGARTRDRRIPTDIRADSLATVPPTPRVKE
ncbi:hypothetical protein PoB_000499600 [Plakobranchus ocellatus]|uniref:Uncharacterized protein n=1 Tax=Plakobranchus ocellatus TaxID=259542 RepID=A0AAV3Y7V7_9GAST|nr:hypothetical protein PoB_000499600 [Plakobranchus ocellatus]